MAYHYDWSCPQVGNGVLKKEEKEGENGDVCPEGGGGAGGAEHGGVDGQRVGGGGQAGREEEQDGGQRAARDEGKEGSGLVQAGYNLTQRGKQINNTRGSIAVM